MRQALHIFKKDTRHLRWEIAISLALLAVFAFTEALPDRKPSSHSEVLTLLPALAWFFLITRVIQSEALMGDKQFWVTRPYSWKSLLAAKIFFLLAFITLPLMIADSAIVTVQGFPLQGHLGELIRMQQLWWTQILLPIIVLAAITSGPRAVVLWAVLIIAASVEFSSLTQGFVNQPLAAERQSIQNLLIAAAFAAIVVWQYSKRRTIAARSMFACFLAVGTLGSLLPAGSAGPLQEPSVTIDVNHRLKPRVGEGPLPQTMQVEFPLDVLGVPDSLTPRTDFTHLRMENPAGNTIWRSSPLSNSDQSSVGEDGRIFWLRVSMNRTFFDQVKNAPVRIRASVRLTLFGERKSIDLPAGSKSIAVPEVGLCGTDVPNPYLYRCRAPFRGPQVRVSNAWDSGWAYTPASSDPVEFGVSPMWTFAFFYDNSRQPREPHAGATLVTEKPVAHLQRELTLENIRMADY